jgi:hypothetical protein
VPKPWGKRQQLNPFDQQRSAVELDDGLEVRRLRTQLRERLGDELVLVGDRQNRVVRALEADRGADLHVHPRASTHRAAEMAGPHLHLVGQAHQLTQRAEDAARPF